MRKLTTGISVLILTALLTVPAMADNGRITVTGEGRVDGAPDLATVMLGVTTEGATAAEAMAANSIKLGMMLEQLRTGGIEDRDIQTSGLSLNPTWSQPQDGTAPKIAGYQASNQLTVRVRALDKLGGVLDRAVSDGANTFNGLTFGLSDPAPALNEARKRAVADAMSRARVLVGAAGLTLGPVVSIAEGGDMGMPQPMYRMDAAAASTVPVAAGEVSTSASVTMVFELKD
ncbi:MAG: SIMPL domain-containing protein [Cereibacter sphaeroides]|uniref:SIMPL domain-containing protein n=1 Tax=Cereibacter sphaeroides TaxID=1063 RepID=A0A2W5S1K9_CERSP|nr:MAG: SIMPL domain-containing protein [Cereibacter sphaeroides]